MGFELEGVNDEDLLEELKKRESKKEESVEGTNGYPMVCSKCKIHSTVPFQPKKDWPVYCYDCYKDKRDAR